MAIQAVFYWDSKSKCVSTLIYEDKEFRMISSPEEHLCKTGNDFDREKAKIVIEKFFKNLEDQPKEKMCVNYKTPAPISNASRWNKKTGEDSAFIDATLKEYLENNSLTDKSKRRRFTLSGSALKKFENFLMELQFISNNDRAFKHRLWATAINATNKNLDKTMKKLFMFNRHFSRSTSNIEQQYQDFLEQI